MDKKNIAIVVGIFVIASAFFAWNAASKDPARPNPPPPAAAAPATPSPTPTTTAAPVYAAAQGVFLENNDIRLNITLNGGGLTNIALLKHADTLAHSKNPAANPWLFNAVDNAVPALAFRANNPTGGTPLLWAPEFTLLENTPGKRVVLASKNTINGLRITRTYAFNSEDPHLIQVKIGFKSVSENRVPEFSLCLNTGTLPPTESDTQNLFLGIATYDGENFEKTGVSDFVESSGFLGIGAHPAKAFESRPPGAAPWKWVSVTNQFFAGILRFDDKATAERITSLRISPVTAVPAPGQVPQVRTATGDIAFLIPALAPGAELSLNATYFVGPREYTRLAKLGGGQEKAVQFSKFFFISVDFLCKIFVVVLDWLHWLIPGDGTGTWGFAIILLTIIIKALTWPLVTAQQRSAERMRRFQGPMKEIREKYKEDQKRMQQEMMKLYQAHKINPLAGCLPVLIQIPVFTGLFFTFQSLAQLRFQSFLWIPDLSMPDVIPGLETIGGFPIHILPLFMGITMLLNMKLTPMPNVEGQQKMIFYGMMIMFPVICYGMPSALMLYYSVQNILTIIQTFITRRRMRNEEAAAAIAAPVKTSTGAVAKKKKRRR
ncbi:MAG: membrane protein insertase YidC [Puniceicoccales bacterium]|jgi:YidC/Oxa1 family membrane protein insertase|nr:membrane protein insertase YidC [Puniceicoccales bacterium]